jgi:hypothetical protein
MDLETIGEFFEGRKWGASALILLVLTMVCYLLSIQILGSFHIYLSYARAAQMPRWVSIYIRVMGYLCLTAMVIDVAGLIIDKRKGMAQGVLAGCILSFIGMGCAVE